MRVALIGAHGQLGTDLRARLGPDCLAVDWPEFDVLRPAEVTRTLRTYGPDVVINCAAQTNVDQCEDEAEAAFRVNACGAQHVARAAEACGAAVVYLSTDYVFGRAGTTATAYCEDDLPGPLSVYGTSKLAGEHLTCAGNRRALIVRTCGLYGHAGARGKGGNFVETMLRLGQAGKPVRVVSDQRLSPTSTVVCAERLIMLVQRRATGLVHVAARDSCTWHEFAQAIFDLAGMPIAVEPITTAQFGARAPRPAMSALRSTRLAALDVPPCPGWRAMLQEYLRTRADHRGTTAEGPA